MKHKKLVLIAFGALALPATAKAPPFETPAQVAFLIDLSSGATLFAKDADRRIPPASMAKMMTAHIAFNLIKEGKLKLASLQVRPNLAAVARPRRRLDHFPVRRAVRSRRECLLDASSLFGQTPASSSPNASPHRTRFAAILTMRRRIGMTTRISAI